MFQSLFGCLLEDFLVSSIFILIITGCNISIFNLIFCQVLRIIMSFNWLNLSLSQILMVSFFNLFLSYGLLTFFLLFWNLRPRCKKRINIDYVFKKSPFSLGRNFLLSNRSSLACYLLIKL